MFDRVFNAQQHRYRFRFDNQDSVYPFKMRFVVSSPSFGATSLLHRRQLDGEREREREREGEEEGLRSSSDNIT